MNCEKMKDLAIEIFPDYLKDLEKLIASNSKNAPQEGNAPFGKGIAQALETAVLIAEQLGFETMMDPQGYYAYAQIGKGDELFGVLGHLDVVAADDVENWDSPPFMLTDKGDAIYGRGVVDDKGPTLAALYAMRVLLNEGYILNKRVRFIFCTDEESLWRGVKAYMAKEELPTSGFTPDADFPLLFAEKGLVEYFLRTKEDKSPFITGGSALNAVPASAKTKYSENLVNALDKLGLKYTRDDNTLTVKGKAAHAMAANEGENAIVHLAEALKKSGAKSTMLDFITEKGNDCHAKDIFGDMQDEFTGKLMFNIGLADLKDKEQSIGVDIRFPVSYKKEEIDKALQKAAEPYGITVEEFDYLKPVHISTDTPLVKALMQAYRDVTGDMKTKPIATGGATFARSMNNIVAFGPLMPGSPKTEHQANECAMKKDLQEAIAIYARAFELLVTTKENNENDKEKI